MQTVGIFIIPNAAFDLYIDLSRLFSVPYYGLHFFACLTSSAPIYQPSVTMSNMAIHNKIIKQTLACSVQLFVARAADRCRILMKTTQVSKQWHKQ